MYDLSDLSVVIVDDSSFSLKVICCVLNALGVKKIERFSAPEEALQYLKTKTVDLLIVDYMMDYLDGRDFTRTIRGERKNPNSTLPMIMLTAYTETWQVEEMRDAGATEIVAKPVSAKQLYRAIEEIIDRPRPFVRSPLYSGPCRRRRTRTFAGPDRRKKV